MSKLIGPILICLILAACNRDANKSGETNIPADIRRYEVSLFNIDTTRFEKGIADIYPDYRVFLGTSFPDENGIQQLRNFVTDPLIRATYEYTMQVYPDLQWLNEGFNKAFANFRKEMPGMRIPQVYTYISGFDIQLPIKYTDSALIIGLDMYLGRDYEEYRNMGYPIYITQRLSKEYILADAFKEIAWASLPPVATSTLLDAMIEQGKTIYFAQLMLPEEKDEYLMKYTADQIEWVINNEQNLWTFIIDNQLLYSTDSKSITMFMTDGPFTSGFSENSPSRTGHWIGWQIVKNYMDNNNITLEELLRDTDSQKILQESGYKPARV